RAARDPPTSGRATWRTSNLGIDSRHAVRGADLLSGCGVTPFPAPGPWPGGVARFWRRSLAPAAHACHSPTAAVHSLRAYIHHSTGAGSRPEDAGDVVARSASHASEGPKQAGIVRALHRGRGHRRRPAPTDAAVRGAPGWHPVLGRRGAVGPVRGRI